MSRQDALKRPEPEQESPSVDTKWDRTTASSTRPVPVAVISEDISAREPWAARPSADPATEELLAGCTPRSWSPDTDTMLFSGREEMSKGVEEFRALRSRLYRIRESQPLRSILITSALPGEGRSFVAANLAQVLALQPKCRVLLIDGDLRSPNLHSILGTSVTPGFSEYLLQEIPEFGAMQRGQSENLFFIPSGRSVQGPTELIATARLKALIDRVEGLFDWIIVDSPAAIAVSDACLLANCCDGVLLVVRSSQTPFDVVRDARKRFREEALVGVILNGTEARASTGARHPYLRS